MRTPKRLYPGDTIGIVSPSSATTRQAIDNMKRYFERRGYSVQVAPNALAKFGFMAGTPQERADDFNAMLRDPRVRMIMTSTGGAGAVHLLPLIDYTALSADPKIVVGLSNPSILLNVMYGVADVPTFHGPNGVEFGGGCPLTQFSEENFWPIVSQKIDLPYAFPVSNYIRVLREGGISEGRLLGGSLRTNQPLIGTPWAPAWNDSILFIEEMDVQLARTDAILAHLRLAGLFDHIQGLIVGQPVKCDQVEVETLDDIVLRNCAGYNFPIVSNVPIGHTDDKITVPIGCRVCLNTRNPAIELLEAPTGP